MHYFIKSLCVILPCILIFGCSDKLRRYTNEPVTYETENYFVSYEELKFDLSESYSLNKDIGEDNSTWLSDFEARVENNRLQGTQLPNMQIKHKIYENSKNLISMVTEKYIYINGVHGNTWWKARNFDVLNNRYITLNDLFYDDKYKKILNNLLTEMAENDTESYHDLWEQPCIKDGSIDNFYLSEKKLVIFFQPYELSYYAKGVVEFPVETEALRGYIREEYLKDR